MTHKPRRSRVHATALVLLSFLLPRALIVAMFVIPVLPRRSWDYWTKHAISGGVTVTRRTHVIRFGVPLQSADLRWYEWSATKGGKPVAVTDDRVDEFAAKQYFAVLSAYFQDGAARRTLDCRSAQREGILLKSEPKAVNLVVRWGVLWTNAAIWILLGGLCLYWMHRRRIIAAERRRKKGLCGNCGYDLTGNVSGVCPECGTKRGLTDV